MARFNILLAATLLSIFCLCCSKAEPVILGLPEANAGAFQEINPGKLFLSFPKYLDSHITLEYQFATRMNTSPMEGYTALLVQSEFGSSYICVKEGLYAEKIDKLQQGDLIKVYGVASASKLPTDAAPKITVVVNE